MKCQPPKSANGNLTALLFSVLKIEKGKATNVQMLTSNTIRTVMGPTGTTVTFPQDLGLPRFFETNPCRYEL